MTVIPPRVSNVSPMLETIKRQTLRPDAMIVLYPRSFVRFPTRPSLVVEDHESLIRIVEDCEDVGPLTKFTGSIDYLAKNGALDSWLVIGDDDIDYRDDFIEKCVKRLETNPSLAYTGFIEDVEYDGDLKVAQGCSGIAIHAQLISDISTLKKVPACFETDDIWISAQLRFKGILVSTIGAKSDYAETRRSSTDTQYQQNMRLSRMTEAGGLRYLSDSGYEKNKSCLREIIASQSCGVYVVSVATDRDKSRLLRNSCGANGLQLIFLGEEELWSGFCMRFRLLKNWLLHSPQVSDTDIIIFSDAYDTYCQQPVSEVFSRFKSFQPNTIVVSAELYLWPPETFHLRAHFDEIYEASPLRVRRGRFPNPPYRYPCAGQYAGTKRNLLRMLNSINFVDADDDQQKLIECIKNHPTWFTLDYRTSLFQPNMFTLQDHSTSIIDPTKNKFRNVISDDLILRQEGVRAVLFNVRTKSTPCFLHANGSGSMAAKKIQAHHEHASMVLAYTPIYTRRKCAIVARSDGHFDMDSLVRLYRLDASFDLLRLNIEQTMDESLVSKTSGLSHMDLSRCLGHVSALKSLFNPEEREFAIVLEDDACFTNCIQGRHPSEVLEEFVRSSPEDVDVLFLGDDTNNCSCVDPVMKIAPSYENQELCLIAYAVRRNKIWQFLSSMFPLREPLQNSFARVIRIHRMRTLKASPRIFRPTSDTSIARSVSGLPSLRRIHVLDILSASIFVIFIGALLCGVLWTSWTWN
jgi:hypothetical protein